MTEQEKVALIETVERSKSNSHRIDDLESGLKEVQNDQKAIYKIATAVELIAQRVGHIEEKVNDTNQKINDQTDAWRETEKRLSEKIDQAETEPYRQTARNVNAVKIAIITAICVAFASGLVAAAVAFMR